jgi:hypothetical protein
LIQRRRRRRFIHFGGLDWVVHSPGQVWQVMERMRSTRRDDEPTLGPRIREL